MKKIKMELRKIQSLTWCPSPQPGMVDERTLIEHEAQTAAEDLSSGDVRFDSFGNSWSCSLAWRKHYCCDGCDCEMKCDWLIASAVAPSQEAGQAERVHVQHPRACWFSAGCCTCGLR